MIFYLDHEGNIKNISSESVHQGSSNANKITLFAPFPSASAVYVAYRLPNGSWTAPYMIPFLNSLPSPNDKNVIEYNVWEGTLPGVITEQYGKVSLQFKIVGQRDIVDEPKTLAAAQSMFNVEKGVPYVIPDEYTGNQELEGAIESLIYAYNQIRADLQNNIDAKVNKFVGYDGDTGRIVYAQRDGIDISIWADEEAHEQTLMIRNDNGNAKVSLPEDDEEIANKQYVDEVFGRAVEQNGDGNFNNVTINGKLLVKGEQVEIESVEVKVADEYLILNSKGYENYQSGIIILKNDTNAKGNAYGIIYDPTDDSVMIGEGWYDKDSDDFSSDEMQSIATRASRLSDGAILKWSASRNTLVDSSIKASDLAKKSDIPSITLKSEEDGSYSLVIKTKQG